MCFDDQLLDLQGLRLDVQRLILEVGVEHPVNRDLGIWPAKFPSSLLAEQLVAKPFGHFVLLALAGPAYPLSIDADLNPPDLSSPGRGDPGL